MSDGYASTAYRGPSYYIPPKKKKPSEVRIILASSPEVEKFVSDYNARLSKKSDEDCLPKKLKPKQGGGVSKILKALKKDELADTTGSNDETNGGR